MELSGKLKTIAAKHRNIREEMTQESDDKATNHGTNAGKQRVWERP